jgi:PDZ domain-containing protein
VSRSVACAIAAGAALLLLVALFLVPVNYAVLGPGPACNTVGNGTSLCPSLSASGINAPLISVPAADDHPSTSHLSLLTVSQNNDRPNAVQALWDWLHRGSAVVPLEIVDPPGQSSEQVAKQDTSDMVTAQDSAVVAAELQLGLGRAEIVSVSAGPATGLLQPGDQVLTVDGRAVDSADAVIAATAGTSTSTVYTLGVLRGSARLTVSLHKALLEDPTTNTRVARLGLDLENIGTIPVTITLNPNAIGGPSAGLMFALGVYDLLTPGNLAGSTIVAGTGTIAPNSGGTVGPIGGIQQKLYAARHDVHATLFLAPQSNCADTKGAVPKGLQVVPVSTMTQALAVLAQVRAGNTASLPHC